MSKPKRHQRNRSAGSKLPDGVVCVTRPGRWGNPYGNAHDFACAMRAISEGNFLHPRLEHGRERVERILLEIEQLRGKDVACWCKLSAVCHGDVLIEYANRGG